MKAVYPGVKRDDYEGVVLYKLFLIASRIENSPSFGGIHPSFAGGGTRSDGDIFQKNCCGVKAVESLNGTYLHFLWFVSSQIAEFIQISPVKKPFAAGLWQDVAKFSFRALFATILLIISHLMSPSPFHNAHFCIRPHHQLEKYALTYAQVGCGYCYNPFSFSS
jgi:hypothetical protein